MANVTPPAQPLDLPESIRAWARGRGDRVLRARANGTITLTRLDPGETLEAKFPSAEAAARALESDTVRWATIAQVASGWRKHG